MEKSEVAVPQRALSAGFSNEPVGTHTSRTIMVSELRALLANSEPSADVVDYRTVAVELNALGKPTVSSRLNTFRSLRELYGLSPSVPIFRALRQLWAVSAGDQPLLAALCAAARDPLFRATASDIIGLGLGETISPQDLATRVSQSFPDRYAPGVIQHTSRHLASSWAQAGLLAGKRTKIRVHPTAGPVSAAYALYLAHLCGASGERLFTSPWAQILDQPPSELRRLAAEASRHGWLIYREAGGVTEVRFDYLIGGGL